MLAARVCDATGNLNTVPFLMEPFTPGPPYREDPRPDPDAPINPDIQADLAIAFSMAPPSFRDQLCKLNRIFISRAGCAGYDPSTCRLTDYQIAHNSWGFRDPDGDRYIGISLGLWKPDPEDPCSPPSKVCAPRFQKYQTRLIGALLDRTAEQGTQRPGTAPAPRYTDTPSVDVSLDSPALSVLASLAHEYGHILWWDNFVWPPGPKTTEVSNTENFCGGNFYPSGRWQGSKVDIPKWRWIDFGDIRLQPDGSDVSLLPALLRRGNYRDVAGRLFRIGSSGRWASVLSAFSPDEDFVETFELFVVRKAGLQKYTINVYYGQLPIEILPTAPGSPLDIKLQCFDSASQLPRQR